MMRQPIYILLALASLQGLPSRTEAAPLDGIIKTMTAREKAALRGVEQCNILISGVQRSLRQSEDALRQAQVSKDRAAEATAREAVTLSRDNYNGYRELCAERTLDLQRARKSLALAQRLQQLAGSEPVNAAVVERRGKVERSTAAGTWGAVASDSAEPLQSGDRLRTGPNSGAEFLLQDGDTAAQIDADTEVQLTLDDLGNALVDLSRGAFFAAVAPLKNRMKRMEVRTPAAVLAVRGTRFAVRHEIDGSSQLLVLEGEVEAIPVDGGAAVMVRAGQCLTMRQGEPVAAPVDIDWNVTRRWWREEMAE